MQQRARIRKAAFGVRLTAVSGSGDLPVLETFYTVGLFFFPNEKLLSALFEARVFGEPPPTVHWKYNDKPLYATSETGFDEEFSRWCRVVIEDTRPEHSGMYTITAEVSCLACNFYSFSK